jgi:hypothetical protein
VIIAGDFMRFDVNRICELAGLGAATGGLLSEAAVPAAAAAHDKGSPASEKKVSEDDSAEMAPDAAAMDEMDSHGGEMEVSDEEVYDIDETELMEALVQMRQNRLEESAVRDAVRDEIRRALSDKSGSWVYGSSKPTASGEGRISRGGFGIGFKK